MARCDNKHSRPRPPCYVCAVIYDPLCLQNNIWRWATPRALRPPARGCAEPPERGEPGGLGPDPQASLTAWGSALSPGRGRCAPAGAGRDAGKEAGGEAEKQSGKLLGAPRSPSPAGAGSAGPMPHLELRTIC